MVEEWKRRQERVEELAEVLRELRIYSGQPERRLHLAGQLLKQAGDREVRREDLAALLLEAKEGQMARSPIGLVVSWLRDGSWVQVLEDLEDMREKNQVEAKPHDRNMGDPWKPPAEWSDQVQLHRVLCVTLFDGKSADYAGSIFGMRPEQVRKLVDTEGRKAHGDAIVDRWLGKKKPGRFPRRTQEVSA